MHARTRIVRANQFVRTTPSGQLDLQHSKEMLRQALEAANDKLVCDIMLDLRDASGTRLTDAEICQLAGSLTEYPSLYRRKIALVLPPTAPGIKADQFQACASNLGFSVQVFKDFEQAIYWLSTVQEVAAKDLT